MTTRTRGTTVSWSEANARRLDRQVSGGASPAVGAADGVTGAVAAMLGAHAQVLSAAELPVGLRAAGVTRTDVRTSLWTDRTLVKTFGPRGTVHLLPASELPMWTGALSAVPTGPVRSPRTPG